MKRSFVLATLMAFATAHPALAHAVPGETTGFLHGIEHPLGGLDHVIAMVSVGLFAARLGGRALWLVPCAFVTMMLAGGALGIAGVGLPFVELGITASIIVLGAITALGIAWPPAAAMALVGFFAVFHGHAHGAEMPFGADALGYSAGFALATALLHAAGVGAGLFVRQPALVRLAGGAAALCGVAMLAA